MPLTATAPALDLPTDRKTGAGIGEKRLFVGGVKSVDLATRSFEGWASVEELDRYDEVVLAKSFEKSIPLFMTNPVMLWAHDHQIPAVGHYEKIWIEIDERGKSGLRFKGVFAETELGNHLLGLYDKKHLRAVSIGFIPKEGRRPTAEDLKAFGDKTRHVYSEVELLEISPVNVPACSGALVGRAASSFSAKSFDELCEFIRAVAKADAPPPADGKPRPVDFKVISEELAYMDEACGIIHGKIKSLRAGMQTQEPPKDGEENPDDEAAVTASFEAVRRGMEEFKKALN